MTIEDFPSLKGEEVVIPMFDSKGKKWGFMIETIQEHCLDKQKVKEAIDTGKNPICTKCSNYIKKELGL